MTGDFWTDERVGTLKRMVRDGSTYTQVANRLGCLRSAAIAKANRLGLASRHAPSRAPRRWTASEKLQLRNLLEEGLTASQVARRLGRTPQAVRDRMLGDDLIARVDGRSANRSAAVLPAARAETPSNGAPLRLRAPAKGEAAAYDAKRQHAARLLADLQRGECRFAVSPDDAAPAEHRFCAAPVVDRLAGETHPHANYCAHHAARMVAP